MAWVVDVARMEDEKYIQSFGGKHEGKRQFGRTKCRWDITMKWILM
jgi:hypothetical protein